MKKAGIWFLAFLITAFAAFYQRVTGPTHPLRGKTILNESEISYKLARSHESGKNYEIKIFVPDEKIEGYVIYKRYKSSDPWKKLTLVRQNNILFASLPHQPPAGKLAYNVYLASLKDEISLSGKNHVIIRFKGAVPSALLIPHVIIMFLAILFSTRAGIEALNPSGNPRKLAIFTTILLITGGLILGPIVQKFAFGAFWTGFPFGFDLTDNKTFIALIGWIAALIAGRSGKPARKWVLGASILLLAVYMIPHSLFGSELTYSKITTHNLN